MLPGRKVPSATGKDAKRSNDMEKDVLIPFIAIIAVVVIVFASVLIEEWYNDRKK